MTASENKRHEQWCEDLQKGLDEHEQRNGPPGDGEPSARTG